MSGELVHEQQQMLMARPWHAAEEGSIWDITGEYRGGLGRFVNCLAMVLPQMGPDPTPLFKLIGLLGVGRDDRFDVVGPDQITIAHPLLLVSRDDPSKAYWLDEQVWIGGAS